MAERPTGAIQLLVVVAKSMHIMVATQREFIAMLDRFPTIARHVLPALAAIEAALTGVIGAVSD